MHKVFIIAITVVVVGVALFNINARRTVASEQHGSAMPSIQMLMSDASDMPQQSFPAF